MSLFSNASKCIEPSKLECLRSLISSRKIFKNEWFQTKCSAECPLECYSDSFDFSLSSSELLPYYYQEHLNSKSTNLSKDFATDKIDPETARKSFVWFSVFYKSLSYETSSEFPQLTWITVISSIAGNLSLFLGVSVFSLFEPVQLLIEIVYMKYHK